MRFGLATRQLSTRRRRFRCGRIDWIMAEQNDFDHVSGKTTTGHEWDGIKELNTPLPRWWLGIFYGCIAWAFAYWVLMPAWPLANGYTHGLLRHSQREDVAVAVGDLKAQRHANESKLATATLQQIQNDADLQQFAMAEGR